VGIQPDTIIPDPSNPQAYNRYSYVYGNPLRYIDPSGHDPRCGPDGIYCGVDPTQATTGSLLGPQWNNNSGSGRPSGGGGNEKVDIPRCGYHHCGETFDIVEAYEVGWQNFGQAWSIYSNPNATYGQRFVAGAYMGAWGGAHVCLILCTAAATVEYLIPGALTCMVALKCPEAVFWSGGEIARQNAEAFARSTGRVTLEMTLPGKVLDTVGKVMPYNYLKPFWDAASSQFARGTSGAVNSFINPMAFNPGGTWAQTELPKLFGNPSSLSENSSSSKFVSI
jgi:hypothetical protein